MSTRTQYEADLAALKESLAKMSQLSADAVEDALEALCTADAEEAKGIDPELLEKYKAIKRHSTPPITRIHDDRCGGCNMQLPAADMNKIRTGAPYVECENCGRIILVK